MKDLIYQLSPNLHIKGNKVISYTTVIGEIKGDTFHVKGKYSRTTTKHVLLVLSTLKLNIKNPKKGSSEGFYKYETGVKCEMENAISGPVSLAILGRPKDVSILEAIYHLGKIPRKDWELIKSYLGLPADCEPPVKGEAKWEKL
jgi:hypothetical protein